MKKSAVYALTVGGLILIAAGFILLKATDISESAMAAVPYICIGLGCGSFGHGAGELISRGTLRNHPEEARKIEIETNDERNMAIANRAKGKAYDAMLFIFGVLMISLSLMDIPMYVILMIVFAYLCVAGIFVYWQRKYGKEM